MSLFDVMMKRVFRGEVLVVGCDDYIGGFDEAMAQWVRRHGKPSAVVTTARAGRSALFTKLVAWGTRHGCEVREAELDGDPRAAATYEQRDENAAAKCGAVICFAPSMHRSVARVLKAANARKIPVHSSVQKHASAVMRVDCPGQDP